ncbi:hypothetical protein TNCV_517431 [Trichonephila clavipes]|nr:hypothetical protein TNCV_517431 [Trichonephila clavipes]
MYRRALNSSVFQKWLFGSDTQRQQRPPQTIKAIGSIQYFVRGGFVGYRSRASSKASLPSSSGRRARFLGGSNRGCVAPADARVGVGSTKKAD